jgi:predicted permease
MFLTVFFQMLVLAIIMGVGFVAGRQRVLERSTMQQMSTMITYVFNPMMMVSSAVSSLGSIDKDALYLL